MLIDAGRRIVGRSVRSVEQRTNSRSRLEIRDTPNSTAAR